MASSRLERRAWQTSIRGEGSHDVLEPPNPRHLQETHGAEGADVAHGGDEFQEAVMAVLQWLQPLCDNGHAV